MKKKNNQRKPKVIHKSNNDKHAFEFVSLKGMEMVNNGKTGEKFIKN